MIRLSIFTMWAWRILRRFTTSVICMRVRNSFCCAFTAKMLMALDSISSKTAAGMSVSGLRASSSKTHALNSTPRSSNSWTRLAPISRHARSVIRVTFSSGWMRRQDRTAFLAPWLNSLLKLVSLSRLFASVILFPRKLFLVFQAGLFRSAESCNPQLLSYLLSRRTLSAVGPRLYLRLPSF